MSNLTLTRMYGLEVTNRNATDVDCGLGLDATKRNATELGGDSCLCTHVRPLTIGVEHQCDWLWRCRTCRFGGRKCFKRNVVGKFAKTKKLFLFDVL